MNYWTELSMEYANQRSYLDDLLHIYEMIPGETRIINENIWDNIRNAYNDQDKLNLLKELLKLELFPIKDSYVSYLRMDPSAIERNPITFERLCGMLYEIGLEGIHQRCSMPKETNRRIGPMFKRWIQRGSLGLIPLPLTEFSDSTGNAILKGSDELLGSFARENLGYSGIKDPDFIGRFNSRYVIGEAKFLTSHGGNQTHNIDNAISLLNDDSDSIKVAILDGVLYIEGNNYLHSRLFVNDDFNIMSSLLFRDFLYQL